MTFLRLLTVPCLIALLAVSCKPPATKSEVDSSVALIQENAASFKGLSAAEARAKLGDARIEETTWGTPEMGGPQIVATYPRHQVRVMLFKDKVITTSFQIIAK